MTEIKLFKEGIIPDGKKQIGLKLLKELIKGSYCVDNYD